MVGWVVAGGGAGAEPITLDGLTFSDELGGVRLEQGLGHRLARRPVRAGRRDHRRRPGDPDRARHDPPVRQPRRFAPRRRLRADQDGAQRHGPALVLFTLELREFFDRESPFGDGLSFGQATAAGRPFRSDRFAETIETTEPFDGVQFFTGLVAPGESVTGSVVITDTTPRWEFYLLQKRDSPLADAARFKAG